MQILKYKRFDKWARQECITDDLLKKAVSEIKLGLCDANMGGGLYKKRIARKGQGKSKGYRTLIAYQEENKVVFLHGFAKNEKDNISRKEKEVLKQLTTYYLRSNNTEIEKLINIDELIEVL